MYYTAYIWNVNAHPKSNHTEYHSTRTKPADTLKDQWVVLFVKFGVVHSKQSFSNTSLSAVVGSICAS